MQDSQMKLITTHNGWDYYKGIARHIGYGLEGRPHYAIVKQGTPPPNGGYWSAEHVCKMKNVPNLFNTTNDVG